MGLKWLKVAFDKKGSAILTGTGIFLDVLCAVSTGRACVRASRIIEAKSEEEDRKLTKKEKAKETWQLFLLPIGLGLAGGGCHIGSTIKSTRKQAAFMTMAAGAETAYTRLKDEIPEVVGKKEAAKIDEAVAIKEAKEKIPENIDEIELIKKPEKFGSRNVLVYDRFSGKWIRTNTEEIVHAQNVVQEMQNNEPDVPVEAAEFYYELGVEPGDVAESHVWIHEYDGLMSVRWYGGEGTFLRADGTEEPYLVMEFSPRPRLGFNE